MTIFMRFSSARRHDLAVDAWFDAPNHELRLMVRPWFETMRALGDDVRELMHDGWPTACVKDAAFAYVAAFNGHANIGFYFGAELDDPSGLLQGAGKRMRHVKLIWGQPANEGALHALIVEAYRDIRRRLAEG